MDGYSTSQPATASSSANDHQRVLVEGVVGHLFFPSVRILRWVAEYDRRHVFNDLMAGLTVGTLVVAQAIAYAILADQPPQSGLYSALWTPLVYAVYGSSRHLAVGPSAVTALLVGTAIGNNANAVFMGPLLALYSGALLCIFGLFRMGAISRWLSHPMLQAYISGAGVVIALSQVGNALGLPRIPSTGLPIVDFANTMKIISSSKIAAALISSFTFLFLVLARRAKPHVHKIVKTMLDFSILVCILVTTGVAQLLIDNGVVSPADIPLVGVIPQGIPPPALPDFSFTDSEIIINSAIIALIGFIDGWSQVSGIARDKNYSNVVSANQELWALGLANVVAGFMSAFPSMAAAARTSVNVKMDAHSLLSAIVGALVVLVALLVLAGPMGLVPKATLAGTVINAALGLVKIDAFKESLAVSSRNEFIVMFATFLSTVLTGPKWGMLTGLVCSFFVVAWNLAYPVMTELGIMRDGLFRSLHRYEEAKPIQGVALLRVDAPLFFANAEAIAEKCMTIVTARKDVHSLVLDASGIATTDMTGLHVLTSLQTRLEAVHCRLVFVSVRGRVRDAVHKYNALHANVGRVIPFFEKVDDPLVKSLKFFSCHSIEEALRIVQEDAAAARATSAQHGLSLDGVTMGLFRDHEDV